MEFHCKGSIKVIFLNLYNLQDKHDDLHFNKEETETEINNLPKDMQLIK